MAACPAVVHTSLDLHIALGGGVKFRISMATSLAQAFGAWSDVLEEQGLMHTPPENLPEDTRWRHPIVGRLDF